MQLKDLMDVIKKYPNAKIELDQQDNLICKGYIVFADKNNDNDVRITLTDNVTKTEEMFSEEFAGLIILESKAM